MKANLEKAVDVDVVAAADLDTAQQQALSDALSAKLERKVNYRLVLIKAC